MYPPSLRHLTRAASLALGLAALASATRASDISFSSLPGNNSTFATPAESRDNWDALAAANPVPPAGYGNAGIDTWEVIGAWNTPGNLSNHELISGGSQVDLAFHYQVSFWVDPGQSGPFGFRIAPDFGLGGSAFLDGAPVAHTTEDLYWFGDWNATSELLTFNAVLAPGLHILDVYGQEGCCDGATAGQYMIGSGPWTPFGSKDDLGQAVPDGGSTALSLALALAGLAWCGRGRAAR